MTQAITIEIPDATYRAAVRIAAATNRPLAEIVRDSLSHSLPPLDDMPAQEADALAHMSTLDDSALWRVARSLLPADEQREMTALLDAQSAGPLPEAAAQRLADLLNGYGELTVRKAHAWLLLARRGYAVPPQQSAD